MTKKRQKQLITIAIILLIVWVMWRMIKGKDKQINPDAFAGTGYDPIPYDDFSTDFDLGHTDDVVIDPDGGLIDDPANWGAGFDDGDSDTNTPMPTYACCDPDSLSYDASCLANPYCYCDSQSCMYPDDSNSNYGARSY
jgi:hypothetical protein